MKEGKKKEPLWRVLAWPTRNISMTIGVLLIGYVMFYCTDVLGMNIGIISTLLLASKSLDGITDLFAGFIVDKTHTRFGKARPYEFFIILQWLFTVLLFAVPNVNQTLQYVYVFIMYTIINAICLTGLGAIDSVYLARSFSDDKTRTNVMSVTGVVIMVVSIVFSIIFPQFINSASGVKKSGWISYTTMLAVPLALIGMLRFLLVKEVAIDDDNDLGNSGLYKINMIESIKLVGKNKYALIIIVLMFITNIINGMGTINTYYFKYLIGDVGLLSIVSLTALLTPIVIMFFPLLIKKLGTTGVMRYSFIIGAVGILLRTLGGQNFTTIMIGSGLSTISVIPITVMISIYLIECMDYGEWKNGIRIEGQIASINNFAGKVGTAFASGVVGVLALVGYDGTLEVQSIATNNMIFVLYNIFPLLLMVIMVILSYRYKLDEIRLEMNSELAKKRGRENENTSI